MVCRDILVLQYETKVQTDSHPLYIPMPGRAKCSVASGLFIVGDCARFKDTVLKLVFFFSFFLFPLVVWVVTLSVISELYARGCGYEFVGAFIRC